MAATPLQDRRRRQDDEKNVDGRVFGDSRMRNGSDGADCASPQSTTPTPSSEKKITAPAVSRRRLEHRRRGFDSDRRNSWHGRTAVPPQDCRTTGLHDRYHRYYSDGRTAGERPRSRDISTAECPASPESAAPAGAPAPRAKRRIGPAAAAPTYRLIANPTRSAAHRQEAALTEPRRQRDPATASTGSEPKMLALKVGPARSSPSRAISNNDVTDR